MSAILEDWATKRSEIAGLDEPTVKGLITDEKRGLARETVLKALHQRFCKLRNNREREALVEHARKKKDRATKKANGKRS